MAVYEGTPLPPLVMDMDDVRDAIQYMVAATGSNGVTIRRMSETSSTSRA